MDKYKEAKKRFEENSDKENAVYMSKYMQNMFKFYGIQATIRKDLYKDIIKNDKKEKVIDWEFLDKCYNDDYREFQYLVVDYLSALNKYLTYDDIPKFTKYIMMKQWWDTVDLFDKILGNISLVDNRVDSLMLKWSKDKNIWLRRIALDYQMVKKDKTDKDLLEKIVINNFGSDEFFINKAIGWCLRDYSKINPEWVRKFINNHKNEMNSLSIREASKYIKF